MGYKNCQSAKNLLADKEFYLLTILNMENAITYDDFVKCDENNQLFCLAVVENEESRLYSISGEEKVHRKNYTIGNRAEYILLKCDYKDDGDFLADVENYIRNKE